ncbi:MAG: YhbY family RNA-binding protein [Halobacteriales archaeon]
MDDEKAREAMHETDATVRVGKNGVGAVADELAEQLANDEPRKVKFLRSARGGTTTDELAEELADEAGARLVETRGHTAVYVRDR